MKVNIEDDRFSIDSSGRFSERVELKSIAPTPAEFRAELIRWIQRELVGPSIDNYQEVEYLRAPPSQIYSAGVLFPQEAISSDLEDSLEVISGTTKDSTDDEEQYSQDESPVQGNRKSYSERFEGVIEEELTLANSYRQSAIGLSFAVGREVPLLEVACFASIYESVSVESVGGKPVESEYEKQRYQRKVIDAPPVVINLHAEQAYCEVPISDSKLVLRWRIRVRHDGNRIVTVSLFNTNRTDGDSGIQYRNCFFQSAIKVSLPEENQLLPFDGLIERDLTDPEELQLALLYKDRKGYGLGHGCAVEWNPDNLSPNCLWTSTVPAYRVPPVIPAEGMGIDCYSMREYSSSSRREDSEVTKLLRTLPEQYKKWISEKSIEASALPGQYQLAAHENIALCNETLRRISAGIELLERDSNALLAFRLMNRAMISQQVHYSRKSRTVNEDNWEKLELDSYEELKSHQGWWRVFQLGFMLANLSGAHRTLDLKEREKVDLIWFPTGGGKTEAYLGLSAFTIFYRRLLNPRDIGCTVLMRYTLRLLTVQQFQRAAALICACEEIRSASPNRLGEEVISIGLWVGDSLTPNKRESAKALLRGMLSMRSRSENKFQLLKCPWCGTALDGEAGGALGYMQLRGTVSFICPESRCDFSRQNRRPLPVFVIDEDIYESPPTLIIGTVDKFATLAWNEDAGKIFGNSTQCSPPDLVIQDELHLISGPVGTMVGLYESVIELLCRDGEGRGAKIVGSTATIRRAKAQCKALYDRDVNQFPPQGLSAADNFFSFEKTDDPGRIYLGICPLSATSFVTGIVRTFSAVFEGANCINCTQEEEDYIRDGYWTLIQYYNSLRELGRAVTLLQQDIPEWSESRAASSRTIARKIYKYDELTSRKTAQEIPQILKGLQTPWSRKKVAGSRNAYDSVLATNMISVGVDIDRLGVMAIVGQPKTTSEYIQASSRVGRKNHPGLVLACYNPAKPRDRSHFETFTRYHSALYRWVEPTSVTPFSIPALDKGLHALLIIAARHLCGVKSPSEFIWDDPQIQSVVKMIVDRCRSIEASRPLRSNEVAEKLEEIAKLWKLTPRDIWGKFRFDGDDFPLMVTYADKIKAPDAFVTPTSLRGVDDECEIVVSRPISFNDDLTEG